MNPLDFLSGNSLRIRYINQGVFNGCRHHLTVMRTLCGKLQEVKNSDNKKVLNSKSRSIQWLSASLNSDADTVREAARG